MKKCIDCGGKFEIQSWERDNIIKKNYCEPKRCPICREIKKIKMTSSSRYYGNHNDYTCEPGYVAFGYR